MKVSPQKYQCRLKGVRRPEVRKPGANPLGIGGQPTSAGRGNKTKRGRLGNQSCRHKDQRLDSINAGECCPIRQLGGWGWYFFGDPNFGGPKKSGGLHLYERDSFRASPMAVISRTLVMGVIPLIVIMLLAACTNREAAGTNPGDWNQRRSGAHKRYRQHRHAGSPVACNPTSSSFPKILQLKPSSSIKGRLRHQRSPWYLRPKLRTRFLAEQETEAERIMYRSVDKTKSHGSLAFHAIAALGTGTQPVLVEHQGTFRTEGYSSVVVTAKGPSGALESRVIILDNHGFVQDSSNGTWN